MTDGRLSRGTPEQVGRARSQRARRRGLLRLGVLLVVVIAIGIAVGLILTGRSVVPVVSEQLYPIHYKEGIARIAARYGLDPYLVAAVVKTESGYDPAAVSSAGAVGLMQLMPDTAAWVTGLPSWQGDESPDLIDPDDNLELGACYLEYLMGRYPESNIAVLAAYNAGQGVVGQWIEAAGGEDSFGMADIVYEETRAFVERVERYRELYFRVHPDAFVGLGGSV